MFTPVVPNPSHTDYINNGICQMLKLQEAAMQDQEEKKISADMEEIIKNIDSIIDRINHHDPGKTEENQQNDDLPA